MEINIQCINARRWPACLLLALLLLPAMPVMAQSRDSGPGGIDDRAGPLAELKEVAFLGISTHRAGGALAEAGKPRRDTGLVVSRILPGSPAEGVLETQDLLTHFDGEVLIDQRQLGLLVRARKEGDEVKLTVFRAGKERVVRVKLGKRALPPLPARPVPRT